MAINKNQKISINKAVKKLKCSYTVDRNASAMAAKNPQKFHIAFKLKKKKTNYHVIYQFNFLVFVQTN